MWKITCIISFVILVAVRSAPATDYPPVVGIALSKAIPLIKNKEYAKAQTLLNDVLTKKDGKQKEVYLLLGNCAMLRGQTEKAQAAYSKGVQLDGSDPVLWLNLGKSQYDLKNYAQAALSFRHAWEKESPSKRRADTLYYSGGAYLLAGRNKKAIASFDLLFAQYPKTIQQEWREQYIHALVADGQVKKALPLIRQFIVATQGETKKKWQKILLAQYVQLKMYGKAAQYARALTEEEPGEAKWWKALAHVQLAAENLDEALVALLACSYLKPLNDQEQALLADLYMEVGIPAGAVLLYGKELHRNFKKKTLQKLVFALHRKDDDTEVLALLNRYKSTVAQSATLLQLSGEIQYSRRAWSKAAAAYSRAAGLKGRHSGGCWLMAGYAALQGGENSSAHRYLQKALTYKRQKKSAASALRMLQNHLADGRQIKNS